MMRMVAAAMMDSPLIKLEPIFFFLSFAPVVPRKMARHIRLILSLPSAVVRMPVAMFFLLIKLEPSFVFISFAPVVSRKMARHLPLILSLPSAVVRMVDLPMKSPLIKLEPIFFLSLPSAVVRVVASVMNSR